MRRSLALLVLIAACGDDPVRHISDAPAAPRDAAPDVAPDAMPCTMFVASTSTATDVLSYTLSGGAFESFAAHRSIRRIGCPAPECR
jgi:hypothetical protein